MVGPGPLPSMVATTEPTATPGDGIEPESADRVEDDGLRPRQLQADLRDPMQSTPQRDHLGEDLACGVKVGVGDACRLHRPSMAIRPGPDGTGRSKG